VVGLAANPRAAIWGGTVVIKKAIIYNNRGGTLEIKWVWLNRFGRALPGPARSNDQGAEYIYIYIYIYIILIDSHPTCGTYSVPLVVS
jgi:hypothetical protein